MTDYSDVDKAFIERIDAEAQEQRAYAALQEEPLSAPLRNDLAAASNRTVAARGRYIDALIAREQEAAQIS